MNRYLSRQTAQHILRTRKLSRQNQALSPKCRLNRQNVTHMSKLQRSHRNRIA